MACSTFAVFHQINVLQPYRKKEKSSKDLGDYSAFCK
jgi:hypothetical protein